MAEKHREALALAVSALGWLTIEEREDAIVLVALCTNYWDNRASEEADQHRPDRNKEASRQAMRLVELLARRSSHAMPYAALGRALLAGLAGKERDSDQLIAEFTAKMSLLGMGY